MMILTDLFVYFSDEDDGLAGEEESEVKHVKKRPKVMTPPPLPLSTEDVVNFQSVSDGDINHKVFIRE